MVFRTVFLYFINFLDFIYNLFPSKPKCKCNKQKVFLVCKITNLDLFNEYFPVLNTKSRVQPSWEYSNSKQTIKIEIPEFDFNNPVDFQSFLDTTDIDTDFFETFCEICIYTHYFIKNKEYINIYQPKQIIDQEDFKLKENKLTQKYQNLICAIFDNGQEIYITRYFKMFLNNNYPITTQQVLIYNDNIDSINGTLKIIDNKSIKLYSVNELI
jgi:hypothetical protein